MSWLLAKFLPQGVLLTMQNAAVRLGSRQDWSREICCLDMMKPRIYKHQICVTLRVTKTYRSHVQSFKLSSKFVWRELLVFRNFKIHLILGMIGSMFNMKYSLHPLVDDPMYDDVAYLVESSY